MSLLAGLSQQAGVIAAHNDDAAAHGGIVTDRQWVAASFLGVDSAGQQKLHILTSSDGESWRPIFGQPVFSETTGTIRDPNIVVVNGVFFCAYTFNGLSAGTAWGLAKSVDLVHWERVALVDCSAALASLTTVWAPELFVDTDGSVHCFVGLGAGAVGGTVYLYHQQATSADLTAWTVPERVPGVDYKAIDAFCIRIGSTYSLLHIKKESAQVLARATASSIAGPWTVTDEVFTDFGEGIEGCSVAITDSGDFRIYYDKTSLRSTFYRDVSADWSLVGPEVECSPFDLRHGTVLHTADPYWRSALRKLDGLELRPVEQRSAVAITATGGASVVRSNPALGNIGTRDFHIIAQLDFPLYSATAQGLFALSGTTSGDAANAIRVFVSGKSGIYVDLCNSTNNGTRRLIYGDSSIFWQLAGKTIILEVIRKDGDVDVRVNGLSLAVSYNTTTGADAPATLSEAINSAYLLFGNYNSVRSAATTLHFIKLYNYALTRGEVRDVVCHPVAPQSGGKASFIPVVATTAVPGRVYEIVTAGTTDFTSYGSPANSSGTRFRCITTPTGDGTVLPIGAVASLICDLGTGTVVRDTSWNAKDATITGTTVWV